MRDLNEMMATLDEESQKKAIKKSDKMIALYHLRKSLELSQKEVAKAMGISQPSLAALEGRGNEAKLSSIKRYVESLGGEVKLNISLPNKKSIEIIL